jgi:hypothetical protein
MPDAPEASARSASAALALLQALRRMRRKSTPVMLGSLDFQGFVIGVPLRSACSKPNFCGERGHRIGGGEQRARTTGFLDGDRPTAGKTI